MSTPRGIFIAIVGIALLAGCSLSNPSGSIPGVSPAAPAALQGGQAKPSAHRRPHVAGRSVYVADTLHSAVKKIPVGCSTASCVTIVGGGFSYPNGVAIDGAGNAYVADLGNNAVKRVPSGCTRASCVTLLGGGFNSPSDVSVDSSGNVYVADSENNAVKEILSGCSSASCVTTLGGGFKDPNGVAVAPSGKVFVADSGHSAVKVIPLGCASARCVTLLDPAFQFGATTPYGVAIGASGNVYVAISDNTVREFPKGCASNKCVTTVGGGFNGPYGLAVDAANTVYVADSGNSAVESISAGCGGAECVATLGGGFIAPHGVAVRASISPATPTPSPSPSPSSSPTSSPSSAPSSSPTSAPTSSPTTKPTASPTSQPTPPGKCITGYVPTSKNPVAGSDGWPVQIIDKSGLSPKKGYPAIYVTFGSPPQYMTSTGALANLPAAPATVPPLPVSRLCVPKTGKRMSGFNIASAGSGRLYIAYGPLTLNSTHLDPSVDVNKPGSANYATKFDWYEFSASQTFFVSNVQAYMFGLPMQLLALDNEGRYYSGGFNNSYLKVIAAFRKAKSPWNGLLLNQGGGPLRVLSPGNAPFKNYFKSFVPKLAAFYNKQNGKRVVIVYAPQALTVPGYADTGTCLAPPTPAPGKGNITPCPLYGVTHDSGGFEFALQKGAPALPKGVAFPKNVTVPDRDITNGLTFGNVPPVPLPGVPTGNPTAAQWNAYLDGAVPFYLIKYLGNDLDRGMAMASPAPGGIVAHPVIPSCMTIDVSPPCIGRNYYPTTAGNLFDNYSAILHSYAVDEYAASMKPWSKEEPGGAYGSPYEDTWSQSSTVTIPYAAGPTIQWIKICVHPMMSSAKGSCF